MKAGRKARFFNLLFRRVGSAHAVIRTGSVIVRDDLAVVYHRVGTKCPPYKSGTATSSSGRARQFRRHLYICR